MPRQTKFKQSLCADIDGFSLHAAVRCGADDRVQTNAARQVVLRLKTAWRNGTTHLAMSPLVFVQRLATLVPRLRLPSPMTASRQPIAALRCPDWVVYGPSIRFELQQIRTIAALIARPLTPAADRARR
jgi:hypothetical protein